MYMYNPITIVLNQIESLIDVDSLVIQTKSLGFKLEARDKLVKNICEFFYRTFTINE